MSNKGVYKTTIVQNRDVLQMALNDLFGREISLIENAVMRDAGRTIHLDLAVCGISGDPVFGFMETEGGTYSIVCDSYELRRNDEFQEVANQPLRTISRACAMAENMINAIQEGFSVERQELDNGIIRHICIR